MQKNRKIGGTAKTKFASNKTSSSFKPFIASSLALVLGMSVAVAQDPTFTYNNGTQQNVSLSGVTDHTQGGGATTNLHWDSSGDYLFLKTDSNKTVNGIDLKFNFGSALYESCFVTQISSQSLQSVTYTNNSGKGFKLGDSGSGTFKVSLIDNFKDITKSPTINLNFNSATNGTALWGNLEIWGGAKDLNTDNNNDALSTVINFGGDLKGNLRITNYYNYITKNQITFSAGKIDGNLYNEGVIVLDFKGKGGITGNVETVQSDIENKVFGIPSKTYITFQNDGVIDGNISVTGNSFSVGEVKNIFILKGINSTLTINGNITAKDKDQITASNNFNLEADGAKIVLKGENSSITSLTAYASAVRGNVLTLDATNNNSVNATIKTLTNGEKLSVNFAGVNDTKSTKLTLNASTLKSVGVSSGTNNTLALASGKTTIAEVVAIGSGKGLIFDLASGAELELAGGSDAQVSDGENKGAITLTLANNATATISGGNAKITNLNFNGNSSQTLNVKNLTSAFGTVTANNTASTLNLDASSNSVTTSINAISGENLNVQLAGSSIINKATLNLNGGVVKSITSSGGADANIINFKSGTTTITEAIDKDKVASGKGLTLNVVNGGNLVLTNNIDTVTNSGGSVNVTIDKGSTLSLNGKANKITSLLGNGGTIDFVEDNSQASSKNTFQANKTLTTSAFGGNINAVVFASRETADQIIVENGSSSGTITISAQGDLNEILSITRADNVQVAQVGTNNISVQGGKSVVDGVVFDLNLQGDDSGNYFINSLESKGVDTSIQDITSSALTVNYDLYLANFNSLNKRMGELRDNPYSQGVWARIFGGATESSFGAGSKTDYVTFQAGYDYSLTFGNARNYMGVAFAYGKSWTKSNDGAGLTSSSLSNVNSNMVEVGIYNSYVEDSGWYNDTILKFDYIMSDFTLNAGNNIADKSANNFAMILSDEFGYRYKFGSDKSWYVDPQFEMAVGYFDQSNLNHTLNTSSNIAMSATQDSIFTLRTRFGASVGKKLVAGEGFATIYGGMFYEYDFIDGGDTQAQVIGGSNSWNKIESNGRMLLNIGTNVEVADGARLYLDVEKSFFGKVNVQYQVNFGARYSFGEKTPTTEWLEQQKKKGLPLPLKVNDNSAPQAQQAVQQLPQQPAQPVSKQVKAQKAK